MNTTDLLLQMTMAATQMVQNTIPPVNNSRTENGEGRDFQSLLKEKRVEAAEGSAGRPAQTDRTEAPQEAPAEPAVVTGQTALSAPQAAELEGLFRALLMDAQGTPAESTELQTQPLPVQPGGAQLPVPDGTETTLIQTVQTAAAEALPVQGEPVSQTEAVVLPQAEIAAASEGTGTATAQAVTPAAQEEGPQIMADAGTTAESATESQQEQPQWDGVQTQGAAQPLFDRTEHMPVKVGEGETLDTAEPGFAPKLAKTVAQAEEAGVSRVELQLTPEHLGKLSIELLQGKDGGLQIIFHVENEHTMKLLQDNSATLVSMLQSSHSGDIQVEVPRPQQGEQPWQQPEQQSGQQQGRNPQEEGRQRQSSEDFLQQLRLGLLSVEAE